MIATRAEGRAPDPQASRRGIDLSAVALRYAIALRVAYFLCICIATLLRLGFDPSLEHAFARLQRGLEPILDFRDVVDAARNIALFVGWGATWVLTSPAPTTWRDVLRAMLWGAGASIAVESVQLFSQFRFASIADLATNTLGAFLGAALLWLAERRATGDMRRGTTIGIPGWIAGASLLMTAFGLAFAPSTRPTMAIGWSSSPIERARSVFAAAALDVPWHAVLVDVMSWCTAGVAIAIAITDRTGRLRRTQFITWVVLGSLLLASAHFGRAMAGLQREVGTWQVQSVALASGLALGLVLVQRWRTAVAARATRASQLGMLVALVGCVMAWSPASWITAPSGAWSVSWRQLVPMMSLFQRQDLSSVFLVLQKAGLGAALGACLAARTRMGEPRPGVRAAVLYAGILELGQFAVPGRYPDVTDVLITSAAAALVAILVERGDRGDRGDRDLPTTTDTALNGRPSAGRL